MLLRRNPSGILNPDLGLTAEGVSKAYGVATVVRDVTFTAKPGEVVGLVGANGAGKSTLGKTIIGLEKPTSGRIYAQGRPIDYGKRDKAMLRGMQMVPQELDLANKLRVWENIALAEASGTGAMRAVPGRALSKRLLKEVGGDAVSVDAFVRDLPFAQQQLVAIARALVGEPKVIFFDEPTASLTDEEAKDVVDLIQRVAARGTTILFASHRIGEILSVADQVIVLRDGEVALRAAREGLTVADLEQAMFGSSHTRADTTVRRSTRTERVLLRAEGIAVERRIRSVSLHVQAGEVLGLYGLAGSGVGTLVRALCGLTPVSGGAVSLMTSTGEVRVRGVRHARSLGIGFLSMDRATEGIYRDHTTSLNILSEVLLDRRHRTQVLKREWLLEKAGKQAKVVGLEGDVTQLDRDALRLSGGQQQRVVIGRRLAGGASVWVLDEPLGGVDIHSKAEIGNLLERRAEAGDGIIVATGDLTDLTALCDRVIVLRAGTIAGEVDAVTKHGDVKWSQDALAAIKAFAVR